MTRSSHRRVAAPLAGAVLGAALLLSGCSAGQVAETAEKRPSVQGVNADQSLGEDGSVAVRDVMVVYPGPDGYEAGADAAVEVRIFNDTLDPVTVTVRPGPSGTDPGNLVRASAVELVGGASPSPGAGGAGEPEVEIAAGGYSVLSPGSGTYLRLKELSGELAAGQAVPLLFEFSNGATIQVNAPVATPLAPVPRATPDEEEAEGGH